MRLLVIGAGMMGPAAAYDMAKVADVESVTLADVDARRAKEAAARVNRLTRSKKVRPARLDASSRTAVVKLMRGHAAALSAIPYVYNLRLAKAAIEARCHFTDLGGNNIIVRQELALGRQAAKRGVAIAPDCGVSPGMATVLAGDLLRRMGGTADALKIYVGGLLEKPKPPFGYQLLFSVEGLINEYCEPVRILRNGKLAIIEPLTEVEEFRIAGLPALEAFHTSGGVSTMPETFAGKVGECFEKTLRYPGHLALIRGLYDLGLFSSEPIAAGKTKIAPRAVTARLFEREFVGHEPDVTVLRVEAHSKGKVASYSLVDRYDPATKFTSMMRTTAWPAAIVTEMLARGDIAKRGGIRQETDVPADLLVKEITARGVPLKFELS
jgi:lysine 6-dehydrogenase